MGDIKEIQSIPVVPFALILGAISAAIMFIWTLIFAALRISSLTLLPMQNSGFSIGTGIFSLILVVVVGTVLAFIVGFILYAIIAIIYNLLAPRIGGIKLELK